MKSTNIIIGILIAVVIGYGALRFFDIIDYYRIPSSLMEPNYKAGSFIITTNLKEPTYHSVAAFKDTCLEIPGFRKAESNLYVGRIVGMGNDVFEIKDGIVFINNVQKDINLNLTFGYKIDKNLIDLNTDLIDNLQLEDRMPMGDSLYIYLDSNLFAAFNRNNQLKKLNNKLFENVPSPFPSYQSTNWTVSNFGPLTIPPDNCFILGDNRHKSEDSRFRGFVPIKDIVGVVIN